MMRRLLKILGTGFAALFLLAAPAAAETMAAAVSRAVATHPEVAAYGLSQLATQSGVGIAVGQQMSAALAGKATVDAALKAGQAAAEREMKKGGYYK